MNESKKSIDFHFLKSTDYRTFHADGAVGGNTPNGNISITFYAERGVIPQTVTQEVLADGTLGEEVARQGKSGIVRELECGVIVNLRTARRLSDWLIKVIKATEQADLEKLARLQNNEQKSKE